MRKLFVVIIICTPLLFTACAASTRTMRITAMDDVTKFCEYIRWGYYKNAMRYIEPDQKTKYLEKTTLLADKLNITSCEVEDVELNLEKQQAKARVTIKYNMLPSNIEQTIIAVQKWTFRDKFWFVDFDTEFK